MELSIVSLSSNGIIWEVVSSGILLQRAGLLAVNNKQRANRGSNNVFLFMGITFFLYFMVLFYNKVV